MAGTTTGGQRAAATNKRKYGKTYYARIGSIGGTRGNTGGFASHKVGPDGLTGRERAYLAGAKGGKLSKRGPMSEAEREKHRQIMQRYWARRKAVEAEIVDFQHGFHGNDSIFEKLISRLGLK